MLALLQYGLHSLTDECINDDPVIFGCACEHQVPEFSANVEI